MLKTRRGFTLIELLVVVVIIGALAAIAIPRFSSARTKSFYAAMKSDLKNLSAAEEIYYSTHGYQYAGSPGLNASSAPGLEFSSSQGVGVTIRAATSTGWSAEATHAGLDFATQKCAIFIGNAAVLAPAATQGLIGCIGETN